MQPLRIPPKEQTEERFIKQWFLKGPFERFYIEPRLLGKQFVMWLFITQD